MRVFASAACVAALLPAIAWGTAHVADPDAPTPAPQYRSVFQDTFGGVEEATADWRQSNDEVGQFRRGHIDLLKWENAQPAPVDPTAPSAAPSDPAHPHMPMHQRRGTQR